ncbi:MAG: acyltransferase family protein [Candidatus Omnitrophica bacterium]|nr:acyltransferase family protein [Candidatus Omnitrophota bacterium]
MIKERSSGLLWINYIRAIAAFGVVLVHVAADVITEWGAIPNSQWWSANIYDSLARGCVPMFIMVSGALLLPHQDSMRDFFRKRVNRVLVPFLTWTILYLIWKKVFYKPDLGLAQSFGMAIDGGVWFHLWFFYVLAGMYLVTPIFRIFIAHASRAQVGYFISIWFILGSFLPFLDKLVRLLGWPGFQLDLSVVIAQGFIGYFILGAFLIKYARPEWLRSAGIVWTGCFMICLFGTGWLTARSGSFKETFYDNLAPNIVLYCASFFVMAKFILTAVEERLPSDCKAFIVLLSKASLGIYLIHPMIIDVLDKGRLGLVLKSNEGPAWIMIPVLAGVVYFVSFFIIRAIQAVPFLRRIV